MSQDVGFPKLWSAVAESYTAYLDRPEIRSIVLVKVDHIGDFALALEAFFVIRRAFPSSSLTLLCGPWNVALARSLNIFDRIEAIDFFAPRADSEQPSFSADRMQILGTMTFDLAIDMRVDEDSRILLDHLVATYRCGYASGRIRKPLTLSLPAPPEARQNLAEIDSLGTHQRMMLLRLAHNVADFFHPDLEVEAAINSALTRLPSTDLSFADGRLLISINPFSGRAVKNWPVERFILLVRWLCEDMGVCVALLGARSDAADVEAITNACQSANLRSLIGGTSLPEAMSIVAASDLYIGNDTGLTHLAARLNVPTIAIYSGVDPTAKFAPYGPNVTVIKAPVACSPCHILQLKDCRREHQCIQRIDFNFVRAQVRGKLLDLSAYANKRAWQREGASRIPI